MLSSLSWNIFLSASALLAGGYYLISTVLLYRNEITFWFKSKASGSTPSVSQPASKPSIKPAKADMVMGGINLQDVRSDARSSSINAEEFVVADDEDLPDAINQTPPAPIKDDLLIGTIADLLEEIKTVSQLIADNNIEKSQIESLFRTLLSRYPDIASGSFRDAVTLYLCKELNERSSFRVSIHDAARWWEEMSVTKK